MNLRKPLPVVVSLLVVAFWSGTAFADYHIERITGILNQPTYVTQAPGDPTNILYYTTRISTSASGFGGANTMGKVWRYDVATRTSVPVIDFSFRSVSSDNGLMCIAFNPDFTNAANTNGYGKIYVSSAQSVSTGPTNRVEEYFINPANPAVSNGGVFKRLILAYVGNNVNNHTIGWIGFDPTATGQARNYLYISAPDGAYGNPYGGGVFPGGRPSQNPADVRGKMLRVDISGGDDYPGDTNKNFVIPPDNPIPTWNAANPTNQLMGSNSTMAVPALGEVFLTGLRNGYRASIDRGTGDIFWGDVGENTWEEVNFVKAGSNASGPPLDFGWPQLEGTNNSPISGAPHTGINPFYSNVVVNCYNPIQTWHHVANGTGDCAIGGYVYRGPIPELQGKYFFSDFVQAKIYMLDFDRNTSPAAYTGSNGILTDVTLLFNELVVDPTTNNYRGDTNIAATTGLDRVVSFGEDNDGNMYFVDFDAAAFSGTSINPQYQANTGEIFKLVPGPVPPPALNSVPSTTNITFTWTGPLFKLQAQTNGLDPNGWADYPNGATNPVMVPFNGSGSVYFRLHSK